MAEEVQTGQMVEFLPSIILVAIGAILTWLLSYLFPSRDAKKLAETQERLAEIAQQRAQIEQERNELERQYRRLAGFAPRWAVGGQVPTQFIQVTANEDFEAFQLDYCLESGTTILSEVLDLPHGRDVQVPLNQTSLMQLQARRYDPHSGVADVRFRILVRVLGEEQPVLIPARIENEFAGNTVYRRVLA